MTPAQLGVLVDDYISRHAPFHLGEIAYLRNLSMPEELSTVGHGLRSDGRRNRHLNNFQAITLAHLQAAVLTAQARFGGCCNFQQIKSLVEEVDRWRFTTPACISARISAFYRRSGCMHGRPKAR